MAALPYMQFYVADYLADTMHLSTEEHGAYLLLIFNYWQTGKPIPKSRLNNIARLSNDRWAVVEDSLREFFNDNGTEWVHPRIEADLAAVEEAQEQRSKAGKASAEAKKRANRSRRKRNSAKGSSDRSTTVDDSLQRASNENPTNKDTDTDTDTDNTCASADPPRRDHVWDALISACGLDGEKITKSARGAYNKAAQMLKDEGIDPDEIPKRAERYREIYPYATLTPNALAKHWAQCSPKVATRRKVAV